jgi:hypothetical protein
MCLKNSNSKQIKLPEQWNQVYPSRAAEMFESGEGADCIIEVVQMQQLQHENDAPKGRCSRKISQKGKAVHEQDDQSIFLNYKKK